MRSEIEKAIRGATWNAPVKKVLEALGFLVLVRRGGKKGTRSRIGGPVTTGMQEVAVLDLAEVVDYSDLLPRDGALAFYVGYESGQGAVLYYLRGQKDEAFASGKQAESEDEQEEVDEEDEEDEEGGEDDDENEDDFEEDEEMEPLDVVRVHFVPAYTIEGLDEPDEVALKKLLTKTAPGAKDFAALSEEPGTQLLGTASALQGEVEDEWGEQAGIYSGRKGKKYRLLFQFSAIDCGGDEDWFAYFGITPQALAKGKFDPKTIVIVNQST